MQPDPDLSAEIQRFEEQYAENPDSLVFARLADAYRKAGETERALAVLEGGLERHPDYASAHVVRARLLREEGRDAEAEDAFRKVLDLDSQNLVALRCLAEMARERGDTDEAERRLEELLEADPRNEEARETLEELRGEGAGAWEESPDAWEGADGPGEEYDERGATGEWAQEEDVTREPDDAAATESAGDAADEPWGRTSFPGEAGDDAMSRREDEWGEPGEPAPADEGLGEETGEWARDEASVEESVDVPPEEPHGGEPSDDAAGTRDDEDPWSPTVWEELPDAEAEQEEPAAEGEEAGVAEAREDEAREDEEAGVAETASDAPGEDESWSDVLASFAEAEGDEEAADDAGDDIEEAQAGAKDDEDLLTETLAGLYETQGFYREALEMYEDLLEQHPDDEDLRRRLEEARSALEQTKSALEEADAEPAEGWPGVESSVDGPSGVREGARGAPEDLPGEVRRDFPPRDVTAREQLQALLRGRADVGPGGEGAGGGRE